MNDNMKILAVDDDPFIIEVLELSLMSMGYGEVKTAQCAASALDIMDIADTPFDCVLLDIQMPETDGIELCEMIRNTPGYRKTPIIMLTAMSDRKYIDRAFAAGATDYVTKPFEPVELKTRLSIAQNLNREIQTSRRAKSKLDELTQSLVYEPAIELEDSFDIDDMPGYMDYDSFRNYLLQLDRSKLFLGEVTALKVAGIKPFYRQFGPRSYIDYITDIADAISENIYSDTCLFSYAGFGHFIVANTGNDRYSLSDELGIMVQHTVAQMGLVDKLGGEIDTRIIQSSIRAPGLFSGFGNERVIEAVMVEAENRLEDWEDDQNGPPNGRFQHPRLRSVG